MLSTIGAVRSSTSAQQAAAKWTPAGAEAMIRHIQGHLDQNNHGDDQRMTDYMSCITDVCESGSTQSWAVVANEEV